MIIFDLNFCSERNITLWRRSSLKITLAHFDNMVRLIYGNVIRQLNDVLVETSEFFRVFIWSELEEYY